MTRKKPPVRRAPRGVMSEEPVYMRLMSDERKALTELSAAENCSISSMARRIFLLGLPLYRKQRSPSTAQRLANNFVEH